MDDNRKHQDTDFSEDDMRLLYALGEATGGRVLRLRSGK